MAPILRVIVPLPSQLTAYLARKVVQQALLRCLHYSNDSIPLRLPSLLQHTAELMVNPINLFRS